MDFVGKGERVAAIREYACNILIASYIFNVFEVACNRGIRCVWRIDTHAAISRLTYYRQVELHLSVESVFFTLIAMVTQTA